MTHIATVTTDAGNTATVNIASHATDELAGIGPVEGSLPSADLIAARLSGREFASWDDLNRAIADLVANDPDVFVPVPRDLVDSETGDDLGEATAEQIAASDAAGDEGHILIDVDGNVVQDGTWAAQQAGTRKVYVA